MTWNLRHPMSLRHPVLEILKTRCWSDCTLYMYPAQRNSGVICIMHNVTKVTLCMIYTHIYIHLWYYSDIAFHDSFIVWHYSDKGSCMASKTWFSKVHVQKKKKSSRAHDLRKHPACYLWAHYLILRAVENFTWFSKVSVILNISFIMWLIITLSIYYKTVCHVQCDCGVATISRLLKIVGLFCRISSLSQGSFAKVTYDFKEPANRSHPI